MGRWIDFKNDYKTMDIKFMESVWWVFSKLDEKGLVYQGYKVCARAPALSPSYPCCDNECRVLSPPAAAAFSCCREQC